MQLSQRVRQHSRGIFYGWYIVAAGLTLHALQSMLLQRSFGAYVLLLEREFAWSKTAFSGAFALQQVESGLLGPLQGWLIDRFGPRMTMRIGTLLFGGGLIGFSFVDSVATFYLAFVVMAVGSSLAGFFPISVTIVNWFVRRRATAIALMQTGFAIGGLLVPLVAFSLSTFGWRTTAFGSGILAIVIGLPLVQIMRHQPEHYGLLPDGAKPVVAAPTETVAAGAAGSARPVVRAATDFTAREALRTRAFWFISLGHAAALLVVQAVNVHAILHLNIALGYSVEEGSAVIALLTGTTIGGQLLGGLLGDRFNKRYLLTGCMIGHASGLLALAYVSGIGPIPGGFWLILVFAVAHGLGWGIRGPLQQTLRADYFGRASFGVIMGFSNMLVVLGSVIGPLFAGIMADVFGNYRAGFTVLALMAGAASLFWFFATRPSRPRRRPSPVDPAAPLAARPAP